MKSVHGSPFFLGYNFLILSRLADLIGIISVIPELLLREPGSGTRSHFQQELSKAGYDHSSFDVTVFDNQETIKQAVRQGLGITIISRYVVEDYEQFSWLFTRPISGLTSILFIMTGGFYHPHPVHSWNS